MYFGSDESDAIERRCRKEWSVIVTGSFVPSPSFQTQPEAFALRT